MSGRHMLFKAFFVITLSLQVSSLFVTTAWLNDVAGTTATLQCNWTASADETPTTLFFSPTNTTFPFYFTCGVNSDPPYICNRSESTLDRQSTISSLPGSVSMVIMNTQCSDEETSYFCLVTNSNKPPAVSQSQLTVKVPPTSPTLSNLHLNVTEYSNITATCTAVVGYPNAGRIIWRVYQNEEIVDLPFKTVNTVDNVPQPGDDKCTVRIQSSVALNVDRYDQNISLACFVTNPDFKPTAPKTCTNPEADLCAQTDSLIVTCKYF
ncbi:uncharacterized protein LOC129922902 [Biomphalaria glabrata]|uniref:Uncharacterized protein LOC129922902 n=1 Tax=Biomphalaria glabrata TaxID=6526 RepID=A0A9W2YWQ5_BIOGL|nr:uncharacterized protein LOC129922902 [Biomphalaria glabrata]